MKRKLLIILLVLATLFCCAFGLAACGDSGNSGSSSVNGTYYLYENNKLDKSQYIKLDGGKWSDDDNVNGTYTLDGTNIVFYAKVFGSNEEMYSGTLSDGKLTIKVFGATMTYYKEGSEPSGSTGGNQGTKPDDTPKAEYTITFDANGGKFADGTTTLTQKAKEGDTLIAPNSPTRTASAFGGWATEKNGKTLWKFATDTVTKNTTLYAVWEEQSATIISIDGASIDEKAMSIFMLVDKNTESVSLSNKVVCSSDSVWKLYYDKLGQTEIPTKIAASKTGELNNGDNVFYIVVTSFSGSQVNVYELTVHRSHSVTVSYFDNKDILIKTDTAYTGYEYTVNYTPNISGYTFNYWKKGNSKVTEFTTYEAVKLYADCTANTYTATLNVNSGEALTDNKITVTYDKSFTFPTTTRTGYTFTGWYNGSVQVTNANGKSLNNWTYASNQTLTAGWQINRYSVTATVNDSKAGTVEVYAYNDGQPSEDGKYDYNSKVTIKGNTNSGYTFLGIYDKSGNKVSDDGKLFYVTTLGAANESYTAKWIECPVTVERNNTSAGTVSYDTKTIAGVNTTLTAKINNGYTWLGWYDGETELTKELTYTFVMPSSSDDAITYTAKWIACPVKIVSSDTNAGTVSGLPNTTVAGQEITIKAASLSKLGYTWLGWYNGEEYLTSDLSYTVTIPSSSADAVTYTANWELDERLTDLIFTSTQTTCTITGVNNKAVTEIIIPEYVTEIKEGAFSNCSSITNIDILAGVTKIESSTFSYCSGLTSVTIPYSVISIGEDAFYGCRSLTNVIIPDSVTYIGYSAFEGCRSLTLYCEAESKPSGWSNDWNYSSCPVVWNCKNNDKDKNGYAYSVINGIRYRIKDGLVEVIRQSTAINGAVIIPDSITYKENEYSVTSIGDSAFYDCSSLTSVTIPDSVTSIGEDAFKYCSSLKSIIVDEENQNYSSQDGILYNKAKTKIIKVPSDITGSLTIPGSVTSIPSSAFSGCASLTSITIGNGVTSIGQQAFAHCARLTSIIIPDSVTSIGYEAFYYCSSLTIYCEAKSKPSGWQSGWDHISFNRYCPVVWDYKNKSN